MNIFCLGLNHRTASIDIRESLWFSPEETRCVLPTLKAQYASECALISTCNRTELYYTPSVQLPNGTPLWKHLVEFKRAQSTIHQDNFYSLTGEHAVAHLFNVASGIDSMVLGDVQILSQIKEAFLLAQESQSIGSIVNRLFAHALHVGKRAKTETEISEGAVSVSYATAELASKIFEDLSKRTALLIGAGETGKLTAKHLIGKNIGKLLLANRTKEHAVNLSGHIGGTVVEFDALLIALNESDIVISAVNSAEYILSAATLRQAMKMRGNRPLFLIDIGVPRNIDPEANNIDNIFLNDIDSLNHIIDNNLSRRNGEIPKVERIVLEEVSLFHSWHQSLELTPTIQLLREQCEEIRSSEVEKHLRHFSPELHETIDLMTKRIVNKILHTPTVNLKNNNGNHTEEETRTKIHLIRHLFGLDKHFHE